MEDFPHRTLDIDGVPPHADRPLRLTLRHLRSDDDYARCEALQEATWGKGFKEIANATMMMISQKVGGVAAGAFDPQGELRGLVFGISGVRGGHPAHWSHILAVDVPFHGRGIGRHLKAYQRDYLLHLGIDRMYWSYDPLVARNAHLNLQRLGAEPVEYARDLYGDGGQNLQHRGLGTDRFIVEWRLRESPEALPGHGRTSETQLEAPVVNSEADGAPRTDAFELPSLAWVRVEIPPDIQTLKEEAPEAALAWRLSTRRAFLGYLRQGHRVVGFQRRTNRCFYLVHRPEEP